jgi:hypothetical protein
MLVKFFQVMMCCCCGVGLKTRQGEATTTVAISERRDSDREMKIAYLASSGLSGCLLGASHCIECC